MHVGLSPEQAAQAAVNGILLGGVYALVAAGLSLIFGVMRVINFAHGEFLMLGGMTTFFLFSLYGINPFLSLLAVLPLALLFGSAIERGLIRRVLSAPPMMSLLLTFGLSFFLIGLAQALFTNIFRSVPYLEGSWIVGGLILPRMRTVAFLISSALLTGVYLYLQRTRSGKAIRATAQHADVAMTCGIDIDQVRRRTFAIGTALAFVAGSLLVTISAIHPQAGTDYILKAFAIVVLGGLGSFVGALYGGLVLGLAEVFGTTFLGPAFGQAVSYIILLLVLLVRPGGIMGVAERLRA